MKNFKNRVLSGALAGALAVTMAVPAFAAANSTEITATYEEPTISVVVPQSGTAMINPYGMPVVLNPNETTAANKVSVVGAQIVTMPLAITNSSEVDLKVSAQVTAEATGDLRIATSKPSSSDTTKSAYVYLQMTNSELDDSAQSSTAGSNIGGVDTTKLATAIAAWDQRAYTSSTDLLLSGTAAATKNDMLVLKASDTSGSAPKAQVGSIGLFRLAGQVVTSPRDAWAETDGFNATVAFSFRPDLTTATISDSALEIANAGNAELTVSLEGATIVDVEWTSDDDGIATVEASATDKNKATVTNKVASTAASDGEAVITAKITASNGLTYAVTCNVTCKK